MPKKIIGLRGKRNVGKSQTIKKVYDLFKSKHNSIKEELKIEGKTDIRVVLTIGTTKIGIESQGDPGAGGRLLKSLPLFVKLGCMVIVCATRTKGKTVETVEKLQPDYEVLWFEQKAVKSSIPEQQVSNIAMAKQIIGEVEKTIAS